MCGSVGIEERVYGKNARCCVEGCAIAMVVEGWRIGKRILQSLSRVCIEERVYVRGIREDVCVRMCREM